MSAVEEPVPELDPEVLRRRRERSVLVAGSALLFAVVAILGYQLLRPLPVTDHVLLAAQEAVRHHMEPRGSLHFSPKQVTTITDLGDGGYRVQGWVEDITDAGQAEPYFYSVDIWIDASGMLLARDPQISAAFLQLPY